MIREDLFLKKVMKVQIEGPFGLLFYGAAFAIKSYLHRFFLKLKLSAGYLTKLVLQRAEIDNSQFLQLQGQRKHKCNTQPKLYVQTCS